MNLRVTPQLLVSRTIENLQQRSGQIAALQQQASTGNRIQRPSDDPSAVAEVLVRRAEELRLDANLASIGDARQKLDASVFALTEAGQVLSQAEQVAIEGSHSINDDTAFEALAQQVDRLLERLIGIANTQQNGQYLFGGTASTEPPFAISAQDQVGRPLAIEYRGAGQFAETPIGTLTVNTLYPGNEIFQGGQTGAFDTFEVLLALRDDLRNTTLTQTDRILSIGQRLGELTGARTAILDTVGEQSASLQNLEALTQRMEDLQLETRRLINERNTADISEVIVQLQAEQNLFQIILGVSGRLFDQSLLDFIR